MGDRPTKKNRKLKIIMTISCMEFMATTHSKLLCERMILVKFQCQYSHNKPDGPSSTSCSFQRKKSRTTNNTNACKPIGLSFECEAKEATRQEADCFRGEVDNLSNFKMMEGPKVKSSLIQRHFLNAKWKKF
jgi:hypothetical protein